MMGMRHFAAATASGSRSIPVRERTSRATRLRSGTPGPLGIERTTATTSKLLANASSAESATGLDVRNAATRVTRRQLGIVDVPTLFHPAGNSLGTDFHHL